MLWFLLSLATAISESLKDVLSKRNVGSTDVLVVSWSLRFFALFIVGPLAIWQGMPPLGDDFVWALVLDAALNVAATVLYTRALQLSDLSLVAPLLTFTPLLLLVTSPLMIGELPSALGVIGIVLIVIGSYLLNIHERSSGPLGPIRALLREPGARLMLAVTLIFSVTSNIDKVGVQSSSPTFWSFSVSAAVALVLTPVAIVRLRRTDVSKRPSAALRANIRPLALGGLFTGLVVILQMTAIAMTLVAYVIAIKRTSAIMSVLFGHYLFKEPGLSERLFGAIVMVLGVVLIALG